MTKQPLHPVAYHLVARAAMGHYPFQYRHHCQMTWRRLNEVFPNALAAVLMPNHLHLLLWRNDFSEISPLFRLKHALPATPWEPLPEPRAIPDIHKLKTTIRYIHLNPCRSGFCADPLLWEWSTHRDYIGAVAHTWPRTWENIQTIGLGNGPRAIQTFHRYVSSDPTTAVSGTPAPETPQTMPAALRIDAAIRAAELICRAPRGQFERKGRYRARLMRLLSGPLNVPGATVAAHFKVHRTSSLTRNEEAQRLIEDRWLKPLLMTLEDPRLLKPKLPPERTD